MILLGVFTVAATLAVLLKDKIENWFGATIIGMSMIVYLLSRVGAQDIGLYADVSLSVIAGIFFVYKCFADRKTVQKYALSSGAFVFAIICVLFFVYCIGHDASGSPDSTYWIWIAKGIYFDKSYWDILNNTSHPHLIAAWGYLAMRTWGEWSDTVLIATNNILIISYLMPLLSFQDEDFDQEKKTNRYYLKVVLLTVCVILVPCISDGIEYSIYASDMIMALALGMGVALFVKGVSSDDYRYYINALVYFMSAVVTKRIAIVLVSIVFIWAFYCLIEKRNYRLVAIYVVSVGIEYICIKGFDKNPICLIGAVIAAFIAYGCIAKKNRLMIILSGIVLVFAIIGGVVSVALYKNAENVDHMVVASSFARMMFSVRDGWYYVGDVFRIPLMLFLLVNIVVFVIASKKGILSRIEKSAFGGLSMFVLIYLLLMFYLYMTQISSASGPSMQEGLLGLSRYMKIIPIIFCCYWFSIAIPRVNMKMLAMAIIVLLLFARTASLSKFMLMNDERITFEDVDDAGVELDENNPIAFIDMGMSNHYRNFYLNMFYKTNVVNVDELSYTYRRADDMAYIDESQLEEILDGCKYLYIYSADDNFQDLYGGLFEANSDLDTDRAIYVRSDVSGKFELISVD